VKKHKNKDGRTPSPYGGGTGGGSGSSGFDASSFFGKK